MSGGDGGENALETAAPGGGWRSCDETGRTMASTISTTSGRRNVRCGGENEMRGACLVGGGWCARVTTVM